MTVCMYRDIHTLQPYIIDFTQRGCHTLRLYVYILQGGPNNVKSRGKFHANPLFIREN